MEHHVRGGGLSSGFSGAKIQPKEEVFGRISLRTSGQKLRSGPPNAGKQTFCDGHPARTSMKKRRSEKLRADFSFPSFGLDEIDCHCGGFPAGLRGDRRRCSSAEGQAF